MDADSVIQCIRGKIAKTFPRKQGTNAKGEWSLESFMLSDGNIEVKVTLKDRDPLDRKLAMRDVAIMSNHGNKGWTGVKVKDDDYSGKTEKIVWVTGTGIIEAADAAPNAAEEDQPQSDEPPPRNSPSSKVSGSAGKNAFLESKVMMSRMANMMISAAGAANIVADEIGKKEGAPLSKERTDAIRTTLFIQASYEKLYYHFPPLGKPGGAHPPQKAPPPPPPAEEPPPEEESVPF